MLMYTQIKKRDKKTSYWYTIYVCTIKRKTTRHLSVISSTTLLGHVCVYIEKKLPKAKKQIINKKR